MSDYLLEEARKALLGAQERGAVLERALYHERTARLEAEALLYHERTARLEAEALAERLQADWDSNAHVGAQALADLRRVQEAALDLVTCATEAIRRADKAEERVAELEAENKRLSDRQEHDFSNNVRLIDQVAALRDRVTELEADEFRLDEDNCCDGNEENCDGCHYCAKRRTQLLFAAQDKIAELQTDNTRLRQERHDALSVTSRDGLLSSEWVLRTGQAERRVAELEALISRHEHTVQTDSRGKLCPECACAKDDGWRPQLPPHSPGCPWGQAAANHRARQPVEGRDYE